MVTKHSNNNAVKYINDVASQVIGAQVAAHIAAHSSGGPRAGKQLAAVRTDHPAASQP